ncbi:cation:proton antiporter [Frigoribacterium sp. CFBP9039]|uniref:cation:proton antiporter n=1 Tax=unclassified Frigoribacterium TaxID=2627005 RepID=UPI001787673A|nr:MULTISPECIES: sodium:proton antiporter [unclassified Frigoribacterium]MBD8703260.1 cation:proton antiporter [Frigoribacterium sp. CFBP 13712]MDY0890697.1 cation:proton antiporter [Frigoribacterium sp. CFBP9030]MDY0946480.1 cation:proton antiporter [Frigoribacterium sp. CFBP9039]
MELAELLIILTGSLIVTAFARWRGLPAPLLTVGVALLVSLIPGVPDVEIDSELILTVVLPPLLYSAALDVSLLNFRESRAQIARLGVGAVVVTAFAVGGVAYLMIPDMTLPAALLVGAVVAPPDAVSAAAIGRRLGLPRKVMTVLSGESLINDAASLTLVKVFLAIVGGASLTVWDDLGIFALAIGVGVAVGLVLGFVAHRVRMRIDDPVIENVIGLLLPFVAYITAEELGGSGVLGVVAAGLYVGFNSPRTGYATRLQERPFWSAADVVLEGFVFALIGLQLRAVVLDVADSERGLGQSVGVALAVLAVVVLVRPVFVFGSHYAARAARYVFLSPLLRRLRRVPALRRARAAPALRAVRYRPQPRMDWRQLTVISWTGMRGVVTLAAAVSIPAVTQSSIAVPARDTMFLIAFIVTVGTLLIQGLTLPVVIRALGVRDETQRDRDLAAELEIFATSTEETMAYVERRRPVWEERWGAELTDRAVRSTTTRLLRQNEALQRTAVDDADEREANGPTDDQARRRREAPHAIGTIRRELLAKRREVVLRERDAGNLDEEVMRRVLLGLDAEELAMDTSALASTRS